MALLWFGGVDRYAATTLGLNTYVSAATALIPKNIANIPLPNSNGIRVRTNGQYVGFNIMELPNYLDTTVKRKWLDIHASSAGSSARQNRYFELSLNSYDIPARYKVQGTVICFGFRFRANQANATYPSRYIGYANLTEEQAKGAATMATAAVADKVYPMELLGNVHPVTTSTQEKYIEYRIKYMTDNVCLIKIFINKDLVHTERRAYEEHWAIFAGMPRGSLYGNNSYSCVFFNDFYMGVDLPGEENPTDLIGPVTAKSLEMEDPVMYGDWTTSDKTGVLTPKEILSTPLVDKRKTMVGNYVISDIGDRPAYFTFKAPLDEKLKIVAFQHDFIAQQPLAYSTSLQYRRTADGVTIEENGKPVTINVALEPNFSHVGLTAITHKPDGTDLDAEYIGSLGLYINSVKKFVPDDVDEEEEAPVAEEEPDA